MPFEHRRTASSVAKQCEGGWWWRGNTKARAVRRGQLSPQARGLDMGVDLREMDETQGTDRWVAELDGLSDRPKGEDGC